ncbi:MAG: prepilin peptidase [Candidatus Dojkabacteria bacterium]
MHIYLTVVIFFLGLAIASFLNALLYRIDNGYKYPDIYIRGSHCEKCNKPLTWYELIPVLSFFIFKGRCKQCGYKVPLYYPVSELVLAISLSSIFYFSFSTTLYIFVFFLFVMSYFDRIYKGIPRSIVHVFLAYSFISFVIYTAIYNGIPENSILLSTLFVLFVFLISRILRKKFGMGDLLVLFGMGFLLSLPMYLAFLYTFLFVALLYSLVLMLLKRATLKSSLPLLPIMYISFSLVLIFNNQLLLILGKVLGI